MKHGKYPTMDDVVGNTNEKGDLIEYLLYDYFSEKGYDTAILKTKFVDNVFPYITSQRFSKNDNIIIPDLICQKRNKDLLFIESKSNWFAPNKVVENRKIRVATFKSYVKFYNEVFCNNEYSRILSDISVCFSTVNYENDIGANIILNFIKLKDLEKLKNTTTWDWNGNLTYIWRESDLLENYYARVKTSFQYNVENNIFSSKWCSNIYSKNRNIMIIDNQDDVDNILQNY